MMGEEGWKGKAVSQGALAGTPELWQKHPGADAIAGAR